MKLVFFGTPPFAVTTLASILESKHQVMAVVTAPDKPAGRGFQLQKSAVKIFAEQNNIPVLQPTNLKNTAFINQLKSLDADTFVVVAFRMLPEMVWSMPPKGTFNLHASLLPRYRGAAPINWAIINGEKETGVSTFFLQHEIDTGSIIFQEKVEIKRNTTAGDLHDTLMNLGASLVVKTLDAIESNLVTTLSQKNLIENGIMPCDAPKLTKKTGEINFNQPAQNIYNLIRGLSPFPCAYTQIQHPEFGIKNFKIFNAEIGENESLPPAKIKLTSQKLAIGTSTNPIYPLEIQLEGKKRMEIEAFLRGFNFQGWKILGF